MCHPLCILVDKYVLTHKAVFIDRPFFQTPDGLNVGGQGGGFYNI